MVRTVLDMVNQIRTATRSSVAIVGSCEPAISLRQKINATYGADYYVVGFYDENYDPANHEFNHSIDGHFRVVGGYQDLIEAAKTGEIDIVYIALPLGTEWRIKPLLDGLSDTTVSVHLVLDFANFNPLKIKLFDIQGTPTISIFETPHTGIDGMAKRLFDIVGATLILIALMVPMCLIALAIKLTSPGPVLYKQKRYGVRGEPITVWKFRSMRVMDADDANIEQATNGDPRITPVGAFLRRTSMDEFPQFFNVLAGTMSLVGPRPHAICHNEQYRVLIEGYMLRHKVKPGITGLAQVNGWRGETDTIEKMEARVMHDLRYIRDWSIFLDIKIMLLTVFSRSVHRNAY